MKKFISVMLTLLMVLSCVSVVAFAAEGDDDGTVGVEAICICAGDINYDGFVNAADARLALRYAVGLEDDASLTALGPKALDRADVAEEKGINAADARQILRYAVTLDPLPNHKIEVSEEDAKWTASADHSQKCVYCGEVFGDPVVEDSKLDVIIDGVNAWAEENGAAGLVKFVSEDEGADITVEINVDAIWDGIDLPEGVFDGFLTKLGAYITEKFGDAEVKLDGETVYNGKFLNTPVKNAIFSVFSGFFYKIATHADGVYGTYALNIDGEDVALTVKLTGSEANLKKVQDFAQVIADHIEADTSGTDLKVKVTMPDALMNTVNAHGGIDRVNAATLGECLIALQNVDLENVIGSQQSAVNKLCATVCGFDAFVNKVAGKVTAATVTVGENEVTLLSGAAFAPATADYEGFLDAAIDMLSDDAKAVKLGDIYNAETGTYEIKLNVTVDVGNAGVMERGSISETIIIEIIP